MTIDDLPDANSIRQEVIKHIEDRIYHSILIAADKDHSSTVIETDREMFVKNIVPKLKTKGYSVEDFTNRRTNSSTNNAYFEISWS